MSKKFTYRNKKTYYKFRFEWSFGLSISYKSAYDDPRYGGSWICVYMPFCLFTIYTNRYNIY